MSDQQVPALWSALQQLRRERNVGLNVLEQRTGIDRGFLRKIERGQRPIPSLAVVAKIAQALDLGVQGQVLLALALKDRTDTELSEYLRLRATLPPVNLKGAAAREAGFLRLPPGAVGAFAAGYREPEAMDALYVLSQGGASRVTVSAPTDTPLLAWEIDQ